MKNKYDVIIVGAGPAGLNCAEKLSHAGLTVLMVEQKETIGYKVCAGGLTKKDIEYLQIPSSLLEQEFDSISFHTPSKKVVIRGRENILYTVDRKKLAEWQLQKLHSGYVHIKTGVRVTGIEKDGIILNTSEKVYYRYLVGSDGATSTVRKSLGLKVNQYAAAVQYIIPDSNYEALEVFCDANYFHSWYAWIFPHREYVSVGMMFWPQYLTAATALSNFNQWLEKREIDVSTGQYQAHPINYEYQGFHFDNIFLAGDAGGFASGLTGEGIYQALISGEIVAHTIIDGHYNDKDLSGLLRKKIFTIKS